VSSTRHWRCVDASRLEPLRDCDDQCAATMYLEGLGESVRCLRTAGHDERVRGAPPPTYGDEQHWYDIGSRP